MRLKIDENLPSECAAILRGAGFEADTVADERLTGADDSAIADRSRAEGRVLITLDLDFASIRDTNRQSTPGSLFFDRKGRTNTPSSLSCVGSHWSWRIERLQVSFGSWNPIAYDSGLDRGSAGRM